MKILSGQFKGRNIATLPDGSFRPTSDKVRQAIFNSMQGTLQGEFVLDLYAGSGSIAFEGLSNGAAKVFCVEIDKKRCRYIAETVKSMKLPGESCRIFCQDASRAIRALKVEKDCIFQLIYLDPPYDDPIKMDDVRFLIQNGHLKEGGRLIIETKARNAEAYIKEIDFMRLLKERKYGGTILLEYTLK